MTLHKLLLFLTSGLCAARAAVIPVGPGETHTTIQAGINAAAPGDTVRVAAGTYAENVVINKSPLTLEGAKAGVNARGRVSGAPNPAVETVVSPPAGSAVELASSGGAITVRGFSFVAAAPPNSAAVTAPALSANGLTFSENHVEASAGSTGAVLRLNVTADSATISRNVFRAAAGSPDAVHLDAAGSWRGLHFTDNSVVRSGGAANTGLSIGGVRNTGAVLSRTTIISGNEFKGHATGFDGGPQALVNAEISGNIFDSNTTGMAAGPKDSTISGNIWTANTGCALKLTAFGNNTDAAQGAQGTEVSQNDFTGNGTVSSPSGYGDVVLDDQAANTQASNTLHHNKFRAAVALFNNESSGSVSAVRNYWNAANGPSGAGPGSGGQITGAGAASVSWAPFYTDTALTTLSYGGGAITGTLTLVAGETLTGPSLTFAPAALITAGPGSRIESPVLDLQAGATLRVQRGSVKAGKLTLAPGAVLDVVGGDLSLDPLGVGQFHTISGTFTFFDSLGSLNINGNTTFSGSTFGLASNIHVSAGVTLTVTGSLILDGCIIDGPGTWNILGNLGATFHMVRCRVTGAFMSLVGNDIIMQDNTFIGTSITAFSTVNGATILHNILTGGSFLNILPGAVVTTSAEGWGNVSSAAQVKNALSLHFRAPVNPTRTLDANGNLYVQPGDPVVAGLDISNLLVKAQATEVLLGYNTDFLTWSSASPTIGWNNGLYEAADESAVIGRFNTATGLSFSYPDPDGTLVDGQVTEVNLQAKSIEGRTGFFFRTKSGADHPLTDNRITASSGGVPFFRSLPFTGNAATLTVDGTIPQFFGPGTATQIQGGSPMDVTQVSVITHQGTVTVVYDAVDLLAGVDDVDTAVTLTGLSGTVSGTLSGTSTVDHGGVLYTRYTFTISITASVPNGAYNIDGIVMDRSGNVATLPIGTLQIQKNQVAVTVQPQLLVAGPLTRSVVFTATNSLGGVLATWNIPVVFTGGLGSTMLIEVPDGTVNISAKMAWNLRVRLPANLDGNGQGTASFTGASQLRGGDFNGDNLINLADYNILRANFPSTSTVPDINGDNQTTLADYNIFRLNWLTLGDPL